MKKLLLALVALVAAMFSPVAPASLRAKIAAQRKADEATAAAKKSGSAAAHFSRRAEALEEALESDDDVAAKASDEDIDEDASLSDTVGGVGSLFAKWFRRAGKAILMDTLESGAAKYTGKAAVWAAKTFDPEFEGKMAEQIDLDGKFQDHVKTLAAFLEEGAFKKDFDLTKYSKLSGAVDAFKTAVGSSESQIEAKTTEIRRLAKAKLVAEKAENVGAVAEAEAKSVKAVQEKNQAVFSLVKAFDELQVELDTQREQLLSAALEAFEQAEERRVSKVEKAITEGLTERMVESVGDSSDALCKWLMENWGIKISRKAKAATRLMAEFAAEEIGVGLPRQVAASAARYIADAADDFFDADTTVSTVAASRTAKGGSGVSAATAKPAFSAEAMLKAATAGKVVQIIDAVSQKSVDLTTAAGRTFVSDFRRAYKAGQCSFAGGRIVFNDGSYVFTA